MKQRLKQVLSRRQVHHIVDASRVPAAVLLAVYHKEGEYYVLFTKRTDKVSTHKGQISFPGGGYEDSDSTLLGTALRESREEIGLMPEDVEIMGELDDQLSATSNYTISPFVGFIPWPYQFKLNKDETEALIEAPVSALLGDSCLHLETETVNGKVVTSYFYHYDGDVIWGATARILNQFLDIFARLG